MRPGTCHVPLITALLPLPSYPSPLQSLRPQYEREAARRGGGAFVAPAQRVTDFMAGRAAPREPLPSSSYRCSCGAAGGWLCKSACAPHLPTLVTLKEALGTDECKGNALITSCRPPSRIPMLQAGHQGGAAARLLPAPHDRRLCRRARPLRAPAARIRLVSNASTGSCSLVACLQIQWPTSLPSHRTHIPAPTHPLAVCPMWVMQRRRAAARRRDAHLRPAAGRPLA